MNANINAMVEGIQSTQAAVNQFFANQAGNQGANMENVQNGQQPVNLLVVPAIPVPIHPFVAQVPPVVVQNYQGNPYTLEKFIKNRAKVCKGTTDPKKAEAWMLNILKSFRAMEFQRRIG